MAPSPVSNDPGLGTVVPSGAAPTPAGDICSLDHLAGRGDEYLSNGDSCYFSTHSPLDFLDDLRMRPHLPVMVLSVPDGWITRDDAELLMQEIDSEIPAAPVVSPLSSYCPLEEPSTVGNEALFLLEGYRTGRYPPRLCSLYYFKPDRSEVWSWWETCGRTGGIDDKDAIRILQSIYPDLSAFPSEGMPPLSIRTEPADDGWYVAFIQEGSGLPILSARCYYVDNNGSTRFTGVVNRSIMVLPQDFSPRRCS
ncbi:MAG: hypothetical protein KA094_04080 [Methanoregulaceae archaeon]|nr:hypothetical protein [Methanoregulaceae archaeon]MCC7469168.1 hypothetical protein [Burkholderiaceae bacterium]HNL87034.1 hypothetical protein [Methanoregulaceae archaeon]HNO07279.1 hypothetical protein [Methanoregulaceae archaeon]HNY89613.1 hypothetical protein [Methanoregulaceae archaeon]